MPNTKVVGIIFPYILTPIPNLYDHSFPRYGQITFLTFRRPTTLTFDLKFWKYLSVTVYPYVICMPSFIMIGWEMAEILHFEILRKHGQTNTQTNTHTNKQTDMGITIPRPPPMGGEVNIYQAGHIVLLNGYIRLFPTYHIVSETGKSMPCFQMEVYIKGCLWRIWVITPSPSKGE